MPQTPHIESHFTGGELVRDIFPPRFRVQNDKRLAIFQHLGVLLSIKMKTGSTTLV